MFEQDHRARALDWLTVARRDRDNRDLRRTLRPRCATDHVLDLASNDYLGLVSHPAVVDAACGAVRSFGAGSTGSRLVTGTTALHERLEDDLAQFVEG